MAKAIADVLDTFIRAPIDLELPSAKLPKASALLLSGRTQHRDVLRRPLFVGQKRRTTDSAATAFNGEVAAVGSDQRSLIPNRVLFRSSRKRGGRSQDSNRNPGPQDISEHPRPAPW